MTDTLNRDVREIKHKVDDLDKSVDLLIRANRKDLLIYLGRLLYA